MSEGQWSEQWNAHEVVVWYSTSFVLAVLYFALAFISFFQLARFLRNRYALLHPALIWPLTPSLLRTGIDSFPTRWDSSSIVSCGQVFGASSSCSCWTGAR